jgi:CHAT domain-containing protein/Tfp pilus assembly protein PilF
MSAAGQTTPCADLKPGIVVESIAKKSEGDKAGLAEGDVILAWIQGDREGDIGSPFDLAAAEVERSPRGPVTLQGTRGTTKQVWVLGQERWDVGTRPNLPRDLLALYSEGAKSGNTTGAVGQFRTAAANAVPDRCTWLSSWLLLHAAEAMANARQWKESDHLYSAALAQAPAAGPAIKAQILQSWAGTFVQRSDWASAETYYQQAVALQREADSEKLSLAKSLSGLGAVTEGRGEMEKAEGYYGQALAIREKTAPGSLAVASSLNDLGNVANARRSLDKAEEYHRQALAIREKLAPDTLGVAASLIDLGNIADARGELAKAEDYHRRALAVRERLAPGSLGVAASLNSLGIVAAHGGDLAKAEEYMRQALVIRDKLAPDSLIVAASLNNLGGVARDRGDLSRAEEYHRRALGIREKLAPGGIAVAGSLGNLGLVAYSRGDFVQAEDYYRRDLAISQKLAPGSPRVSAALNNLGLLESVRGDLAKAEECHRQALAIRQKLAPGSLNVAGSLNNLGLVAQARGDLDKAEEYHRQALAILEKLAPGSLDMATGFGNLGSIAEDRGDFSKAEEHYRQALAIFNKLVPGGLEAAETEHHLGDMAQRGNDLVKAEAHYRQALEIRKKLAPQSQGYAESLAAMAGIMRGKGQPDAAGELFHQALDALEGQTARLGGSSEIRSSYRAKHAGYYSEYLDLLMSRKQPELAFEVLERSRARTLLETLSEARVDIRQGVDPLLLEQERLLGATIRAKTNRRIETAGSGHTQRDADANKEIDELLAQYGNIQGRIRTASPRYAALTQPRPLSTKAVQQQLLDAGTVLLEYALGPQRSYVFVLTPTTLEVFQLPKREEIETAAQRVYTLLTTRSRPAAGESNRQRMARLTSAEAEYWTAAAQLSRMVIAPVAARIEGKRLLISGDGVLQYIPFAILPDPDSATSGADAASRRSPPLLAGHEIVNLPSASVLGALRREQATRGAGPRKAVAVLADPVFDKDDPRVLPLNRSRRAADAAPRTEPAPEVGDRLLRSAADVGLQTGNGSPTLPRLAFSRREAAAIMALTPEGLGLEAVDFQASRETALSPQLADYRIVHFATHGLLDSKHPELSGLVLSMVDERGSTRDGFLSLDDIYNLNLPADLVVLSACETGLGKEIAGEGLVGMTSGFMYAGARRVMASLWKVDDVATAELMAHFYRGVLKEGMTPAAALRQAQLQMWKQKPSAAPYHWGAFTLQGEWR